MAQGRPVTVKYETLVIIWLALLVSHVMFLAIVWYLKPELFAFGSSRSFLGDIPLVTIVFVAIAIVFLLLSFVLSRQHMRRAVQDQDASCVQTGLVLGCALSEVPALLGLVLAFVFDHPYFFLWIVAGALGILLHFPRKGSLNAATYRLK